VVTCTVRKSSSPFLTARCKYIHLLNEALASCTPLQTEVITCDSKAMLLWIQAVAETAAERKGPDYENQQH